MFMKLGNKLGKVQNLGKLGKIGESIYTYIYIYIYNL